MVFLVTIVLQSFFDSERVVTNKIVGSRVFSTIIETSSITEEVQEEFDGKLTKFIETKGESVRLNARMRIEIASVSTVKL